MTVLPVVRQFIESRDHRLMRKMNRWDAPTWFRMWMLAATRGGDGWLWYGLAVSILLFGGPDRFPALSAAGIAAGTGIFLFLWLKRLAGRRRPCALEPHVWANLLPPDQFSFPSGHTITAFAMAISAGGFYPPLMAPLLFVAVSIGISRVVLGMHFLSDVVAGALIGSLLGYFSCNLFQ